MKLNEPRITLREFYSRVSEMKVRWPDLRWGQCMWNVLSAIENDFVVQKYLTTLGVDPYYDNSQVDAFVDQLLDMGYFKAEG
jgi:hypothetical protein